MRREYAIAGLAAGASAALFLSLTAGVLGGPLLAYFVQLPLLYIGLSMGAASATVASIGSVALVVAFGGGVAALVFLVVQVGPTLITVRQSLLNRSAANGVEWYPAGLVLGQLVLFSAVVLVLALIWVRLETGSIENAFATAIDEVLAQFGGAGTPSMPVAQQIAEYASIVPGIIAVSWVLMTVMNAAFAQLLARRGSQAIRPSFDLAQLQLPSWCGPALAAASLAALLADGDLAYFAQGLAALFAVPYLMQGLAVVHSLAAKLPARGLALAGFYLVLLLFSWPLVVGVVVLGLVEDWAHLRRRMA